MGNEEGRRKNEEGRWRMGLRPHRQGYVISDKGGYPGVSVQAYQAVFPDFSTQKIRKRIINLCVLCASVVNKSCDYYLLITVY